jgi:hypothetical protein
MAIVLWQSAAEGLPFNPDDFNNNMLIIQTAVSAAQADILTKATKTGDETIAGVKTFSSSPIVPLAAAGDDSTKAASTSFVQQEIAGFSLDDLSDVLIGTPVAGDAIVYNGSTFVNAASATNSLAGMSDVALVTPADDQVLTYNSTSSKWENAAIPAVTDATTQTDTDDSTKIATTAFVKQYNVTGEADANATYTFVLADAGKVKRFTAAGNITATVPPNSSVAFPLGTQIVCARYTTYELALVAGSGVTIRSSESKLRVNKHYEMATLIKVDTNEWILAGALKT